MRWTNHFTLLVHSKWNLFSLKSHNLSWQTPMNKHLYFSSLLFCSLYKLIEPIGGFSMLMHDEYCMINLLLSMKSQFSCSWEQQKIFLTVPPKSSKWCQLLQGLTHLPLSNCFQNEHKQKSKMRSSNHISISNGLF